MIKRLIVSCIFFLSILSCSVESDSNLPQFTSIPVPIDSVIVPDEFIRGQTHNIVVKYLVPNSCYFFNDFFTEDQGNTKTVVLLNNVLNNNCEPYSDEMAEASFDFRAGNSQSYIFKFWKGKDFNGEDNYEIIEVPVSR